MKKEDTKFITIMALIEKIRASCKNKLKETTEGNISVFSLSVAEDYEWSLKLDHSSDRIQIFLSRPMIKFKEEFSLREIDILVGVNYIEFYKSSERYVHLDFDQYNVTKDIEATAKPVSKKRGTKSK